MTGLRKFLARVVLVLLYVALAPFTLWIALEWALNEASEFCGLVADWISEVIPEPMFNAITSAFEWLGRHASGRG